MTKFQIITNDQINNQRFKKWDIGIAYKITSLSPSPLAGEGGVRGAEIVIKIA